MASCSRCAVESLIVARGIKNVIEIIRPKWRGLPETAYEIYVATGKLNTVVHPTERTLFYKGLEYRWAMTLFSTQHSDDEDCMVWLYGSGNSRRKPGMPTVRLTPGELEIMP
jgi:hypothetical protein